MWPRALRLDDSVRDPMALHISMLERVRRRADRIRHPAFPSRLLSVLAVLAPVARPSSPPCTAGSTCRNIRRCSTRSASVPVVSISERAARAGAAGALAEDGLSRPARRSCCGRAPSKSDYLAFLGRIAPEKAVDRAIRIAERCGLPLKIAAKVDRADRDYFERRDPSRCSTVPGIEYIGEIGDATEVGVPERRAGAAHARSTGPSRSAW